MKIVYKADGKRPNVLILSTGQRITRRGGKVYAPGSRDVIDGGEPVEVSDELGAKLIARSPDWFECADEPKVKPVRKSRESTEK